MKYKLPKTISKCHLFLIFTHFNEDIYLGPNQSLRGLSATWQDDWTSEFWGSGLKCEDVILKQFFSANVK